MQGKQKIKQKSKKKKMVNVISAPKDNNFWCNIGAEIAPFGAEIASPKTICD